MEGCRKTFLFFLKGLSEDTLLTWCYSAGTNPIHNKKAKKAKQELDEDDLAFKAKQQAGAYATSSSSSFLEETRLRRYARLPCTSSSETGPVIYPVDDICVKRQGTRTSDAD
ncbi:unnamed protein product [Periconia digitata]|uniref:Uncharacterized protein n=1 Tax=Periconia digitata TaxID=1303443 RepID=A0A9W4XGB7_9PLEO|nr:unnamed protein product [Periconia digitata]